MSKPQLKTTKQPERVKHAQGLTDFLKLGPDRSLGKLHRWYAENMPRPPSLPTLKNWSVRYSWQTRAVEHDTRVAVQVGKRAEAASIEEGWDRVQILNDVARRSLEKAAEALANGKIAPATAYEVQSLINTAVTAIKTGELLSGHATDRSETSFLKDHCPDWMREDLLARQAERKRLDHVKVIEDITEEPETD
jgi:hypothetical protein